VAQGQFTYTLTVESRQYKRELAQASKLATNLAKDLSKSLKSQQGSLNDLGQKLQATQRQFQNLSGAVKAFPGVAKGNERDQVYLKRLADNVRDVTAAFFDGEKGVKKYQTALGRLTKLDPSQIRRAQVMADPAKARDDLSSQNRRNKERLITLNRVSEQLRVATAEQKRLNLAGLDTAKVDLQVARLVATHARLNNALDKGVASAARLEGELKDVARQQQLLGRTQYNKPIGPAVPMRGFGGNTGKRAAIGGRMSKMGGSAGVAGAALTGGIAGLAAAAAGQAVEAVMALGRAVGQYASDAATAAAETTRMRRALAGVLGAEAPEAFAAIKRVVSDFNVPLQDATTNFTRFAASAKSSGVDAVDIEKSFRGLIAANKALGGSQEQANGILLAATQVFGKGKVAAEELRGQIAERLPGSVALFAKSMGLTTAELDKRLEEGTVSVADFVKFTGDLLLQFEKDAKAISRGPEEAGQRLEVALDLLQRNIGTLLAPIGAAFQTTFALIVGAINTGIEAMNRFLGLTPEAAVEKAQSALEARQRDLTNAIKGEGKLVDIGMQGSSRRQTESEARAELDQAIKALDKARKVVGTGKGSIEKDKMVTAEDLIANRRGKGKSAAQRAAEQTAKIMSANERRLAEENARQATATLKARYALQRQLEQANQNHVVQGLHGGRRMYQEIYNSFTTQISALQEQGKQLEDAVSQAEARVEAAKAELATATTGPDQERAQGRVDMETAKLAGAQQRAADFDSKSGELATFAFADMLSASTASFRERAYQLKTETEDLKLRNRLMMEGFSPEMIQMQMQQAEIDRIRNEELAQLNELQKAGGMDAEYYAKNLQEINIAADNAKDAVEALTQAQIAAADPIKNYIATAQEYVSNTKERLGEMLATVDQALAASIEGIVTGTMTIGQAFQSFFKSIGQAFLKMAAQMIAKLIIIKLLKTAIGMFGGGGAEAPSEGLNLEGIEAYTTPGPLPTIGDLQPFATGGIINKPTAALIGEGGMNEAVVPLPNGRSIPVDLGKGGAGQMTNNTTVTVNVDNSGGATSDIQGDDAGKLGQAIDGAIRKVIMEERRSGGLLYTGGR
jgi:lambda family phage tail tape measure protein